MSQLIVSKFDVLDLSSDAIRILRAAVRHAQQNQRLKMHTFRIDKLCHMAGVPATTKGNFLVLLKEARKALVVVELIDTESPKNDDLPYASWPVFKEVSIDGSKVTFEVSSDTLVESVLANLPTPDRGRVLSAK